MAVWTKTKLSVKPANYEMADTDRVAFTFAAGEEITNATAQLLELPSLSTAASSIESTTVNDTDDGAVVVIENLTRGEVYELAVTFIRADLTTWTKTLVLECVA
jgi:prephenate dehydratase